MNETGGGEGKGGWSMVLHGIFPPPSDGVLLLLPGKEANSDIKRLAGGCWEPHKCPTTMCAAGKYPWSGRGGFTDLGDILRDVRASKPPVWVVNMVDDPLHGASLRGAHHRVSQRLIWKLPQLRMFAMRYNPPPPVRCSELGGSGGYDVVHFTETEYSRSLHRYKADYGAMIGRWSTSRGAGREEAVVTGGDGPGGRMGGIRGGNYWGVYDGETEVPKHIQRW